MKRRRDEEETKRRREEEEKRRREEEKQRQREEEEKHKNQKLRHNLRADIRTHEVSIHINVVQDNDRALRYEKCSTS